MPLLESVVTATNRGSQPLGRHCYRPRSGEPIPPAKPRLYLLSRYVSAPTRSFLLLENNAELTRWLRPEAKPRDWRDNCVPFVAHFRLSRYYKSNYRDKRTDGLSENVMRRSGSS
jgi:hypothetical protein